MSFIEIYYNPSSNDWDLQADLALKEIDYIPTVILCYPMDEEGRQKKFDFRFITKDQTN